MLLVVEVCFQRQMLIQIVSKYLLRGVSLLIIVVLSDKIQVFFWKTNFKELAVLCITFFL